MNRHAGGLFEICWPCCTLHPALYIPHLTWIFLQISQRTCKVMRINNYSALVVAEGGVGVGFWWGCLELPWAYGSVPQSRITKLAGHLLWIKPGKALFPLSIFQICEGSRLSAVNQLTPNPALWNRSLADLRYLLNPLLIDCVTVINEEWDLLRLKALSFNIIFNWQLQWNSEGPALIPYDFCFHIPKSSPEGTFCGPSGIQRQSSLKVICWKHFTVTIC